MLQKIRFLLALSLVTTLLPLTQVAWGAGTVDKTLFSQTVNTHTAKSIENEHIIKGHWRRFVINDGEFRLLSQFRPGDQATLLLIHNETIQWKVLSAKRGMTDSWVVQGRVTSQPTGRVSLVVTPKGNLVGKVFLEGERYFQIHALQTNIYQISQMMPSAPTDLSNDVVKKSLQSPNGDQGDDHLLSQNPFETCADRKIVDVLFVYTSMARMAHENAGMDIVDRITALVEDFNQIYENSGMEVRLNIAGTREEDYDEVGTLKEHLKRLESSKDGIMDGAIVERELIRADLVALLISAIPSSSGSGGPFGVATFFDAFSVSRFRPIPADDLLVAHEIGHNMGADHEKGKEAGGAFYSFARGHLPLEGSGSNGTVMVTGLNASNKADPHFSNPDILFSGGVSDGLPTGVPNVSNNALAINLQTNLIAIFRCANPVHLWVDFAFSPSPGVLEDGTFHKPFNTLEKALAKIKIGQTIGIKAGTGTASHLLINQNVKIISVDGSATIN